MATKAEIDAGYLAQHNLLTQKFYQMRAAGQITPALQSLFDKVHGYLSHLHMRDRIANGIDPDFYVLGANDVLSSTLQSAQLTADLNGPLKLSASEKNQAKVKFGVDL